MRAEEYDWTVYHLITGAKVCTIEDICEKSGFPGEIVQESVDRLCSNLLVICRGDTLRACSIEEYLITSRMKHDPHSDIIIENGIIKVKDQGKVSSGAGNHADMNSREKQ